MTRALIMSNTYVFLSIISNFTHKKDELKKTVNFTSLACVAGVKRGSPSPFKTCHAG